MRFIFLPGIIPNLFFNLPNTHLLRENVKSFRLKLSPRLWYLVKNISFPPLFHPDSTTAITSISKAELFSQTSANKSILNDSVLDPLSSLRSDYFMSSIEILLIDISLALAGPNPPKAYELDGNRPILKNCASMLFLCRREAVWGNKE